MTREIILTWNPPHIPSLRAAQADLKDVDEEAGDKPIRDDLVHLAEKMNQQAKEDPRCRGIQPEDWPVWNTVPDNQGGFDLYAEQRDEDGNLLKSLEWMFNSFGSVDFYTKRADETQKRWWTIKRSAQPEVNLEPVVKGVLHWAGIE